LQLGFCTLGAVITNTIGAGAGYTIRAIGFNGSSHFVGTDDLLNSAGGSVTASFTSTENNAAIKATVGLGIFTSAFVLSGSAGIASANVAYSGTASGSVTADGSGNYTIPSLGPGSYTITPTLTGYAFTPTSRNQTITTADVSGVNFTAAVSSGNTAGTNNDMRNVTRWCSRIWG
jgi:inhibitor of cysteine peptidase